MAGANVAFSNLVAALSQGKEVIELRKKLDKELEQSEQIESDEQKQRTKTAILSLTEDVSNKVVEISRLRKEKEREMEEDDFLDDEDQKILEAYITAEKEAVQLAKDIQKYISQDDDVMGRQEKPIEGQDKSKEPTSGTSSTSSVKAKRKEAKQMCPTCGKFYKKVWLDVHKKRCGKKEEREKFKCNRCHSSFLTKSYLNKHMESCTGKTKSETSRECPKCSQVFTRTLKMRIHAQKCDGQRRSTGSDGQRRETGSDGPRSETGTTCLICAKGTLIKSLFFTPKII